MPPSPPRLELRRGVVVIGGSVEPADVTALWERASAMLVWLAANDADPLVCDVGAFRADLAAVEALARLALAARRLEARILMRDATPALRELLAVTGLADVVPCDPESGVDAGR